MPGQTSLEDALVALRSSAFAVEATMYETRDDWAIPSVQTVDWMDPSMGDHEDEYLSWIGREHRIVARDGIVRMILLRVNQQLCHLTAKEVIELFGEPEAALFTPADGPLLTPVNEVTLLYPSRGVVFGIWSTYPPVGDAPVDVVVFVTPQGVHTLFSSWEWHGWAANRVEWEGLRGE